MAPKLKTYYIDYNTLPPVYNLSNNIVSGKVVDRDGTIQYLIMIRDGAIDVFDLDGNAQTVATPNGTDYLDIANTAEPADKFRIASVADYTFICNREKVVTMDHAGTYTQSGTTITVTSNNHGVTNEIMCNCHMDGTCYDTVSGILATKNTGYSNGVRRSVF